MDLTEVMKYISKEALVIVPVCWIVGFAIKKAKFIADKLIPLVLLVVGAGIAMAILGPTAQNAVQGLLCAGASVLIHQIKRQLKDK